VAGAAAAGDVLPCLREKFRILHQLLMRFEDFALRAAPVRAHGLDARLYRGDGRLQAVPLQRGVVGALGELVVT
jgi:hypothetical protein